MEQSPQKKESEIQESASEEVLKSNGEKENEIQESASEEVLKSNGEKELTQKVSEGKEVESSENSQVLVKRRESVQNLKMAVKDFWLLVTSYLLSYKIIQPMAEDSVYFVEYVAGKLDSFCSKYETISDVKILDVIGFVRSCASEGLEFLKSNETDRRVLKYLVHSHLMILESLDCTAEVMELVVPTVPGVKPLLELEAGERSIRKKSFYIIVNFWYRIIQKMVAFAEGLCGQLKNSVPSWFLFGKAAVDVNVAVK